MTDDSFIQQLVDTPPSCIRDFNLSLAELPEEWDDNPTSVWRLACKCGCDYGSLLGHPLADYNSDYDGPLVFISPLGFRCAECADETEILDTDLHGYHAEIHLREGISTGGSCKRRGTGRREAFPCPACDSAVFCLAVGFVFWDAEELAEEFDDRWEDLFNVFLCYATCRQCGHVSIPTDFGKL